MGESIGPVVIKGPVDKLEFRSLVGVEQLSQPFRYDIEFLSDKATLLSTQFLGEPLTVTLDVRKQGKRHFNGIVTDFSLRGSVGEKTLYAVTVRPWLWLLTQRINSKIHKGTVPEIVRSICGEYMYSDVQTSLLDDVEINREFVVQYEESDFNFVMRLLEQDGIYFFFTHTDTKHSMMLTASGAYDAEHYAKIEFFPPDVNRQAVNDHIDHFVRHESLAPGVFVMKDFDFTAPRAPLLVGVPIARPHSLGDFEVFHFPGGYLDLEVGRNFARRRLEALQVAGERFEAQGNARGVGAGQQFELTGHPLKDLNRQYLVFSTGFQIRTHDHQSGGSIVGADVMRFNMVALDRNKPFRPALRTPKPRILGVQSAVVVGPDKQEIETDLDGFGMVKVKFHWDRSDVTDGSNCLWIRVSQPWAGTNFGVLFTPRIGQEVLVEFLEGDPDQPIIVGRVYNNDHMPPYDLPLENTKSGIKTHSSMGGSISNFNEIRFEDKKGSEELFVQAEKTHTVNVKGSRSVSVGGTQSTTVTGKETRTYKDERDTDVKLKDHLKVHQLRKTEFFMGRDQTVSGAEDKLVVDGQDKTTKVGNSWKIDTGTGFKLADATDTKVTLEGKEITIEAPTKVTLKCGESTSITLDGTSVKITAANISINGTTSVNANGSGYVLQLAKGGAQLTSPDQVVITGPAGVKLNS
ncbi:MAG TPA: type VI secretion system tip protein TssI/VgrG [Polyangiaceae bacterium]|nr:type VI secretion system tip protein TssI/VgrG [Polyangiaceae bacterium]